MLESWMLLGTWKTVSSEKSSKIQETADTGVACGMCATFYTSSSGKNEAAESALYVFEVLLAHRFNNLREEK
ncbi:Thioredoxin reductase [Frankliniella fusca]|uniref:Thioredoxin reductase n=1 Tax=Frankliniella fusca TaxID=407009 RepID=A0AAE1HCH3_9NEOP|nr:Thioredoxin reductase [Frankliniella fusca]